MKSMLKALSAVALLGTLAMPVFADDATLPATTDSTTTDNTAPDAKDQKDLKKVIEDQGINYVETAQKGITLSGYVDTSYTYQFAGAGEYGPTATQGNGAGVAQNFGTGPGNAHAALRQFDTSNNTFNINAVKIALEKALPDKNEWAAGFRIDTIYGQDAKYLGDSGINGIGANTSGLALEQALVKFRIPIGNGLDIYAGKFVTFLGYEVIESPANLNFSRGLLFTNLIPLTHTGVYADYKFNSTFEAKLGVVDGWNNSTSSSVGAGNGINGNNASGGFGKAITGQLVINAPGNNASITQSFIYSPDGEPGVVGGSTATGAAAAGVGAPGTNAVNPVAVYDVWGNWNPTFDKSGNLLLGFNVDLGTEANTGFWGAALYAQYKFTKVFSLAGRAEYIHDDSSPGFAPGTSDAKFGVGGYVNSAGVFVNQSQDDFAYTLTASFNVWDNLLTRIEYRIDDLSGNSTGTGHTAIDNEISLNAVYSF